MLAGTEGNVKSPSPLEVALNVAPVAWSARLHPAAGMAAPVESTSVPLTELVVLCANATLASSSKLPNRTSMFLLFQFCSETTFPPTGPQHSYLADLLLRTTKVIAVNHR